MKNNIKEYKGLSEEDKKYLREFDNAVEKGIFKDDKVKLSKKTKKEIEQEREEFRRDFMVALKRGGGDVDEMIVKEKLVIGKKRVEDQARDGSGKFTKKEKE